MRQELREKVKTFPDRPGVYLMRGKKGEVVYVGKATSLKKRVLSYFKKDEDSPKTAAQMEEVRSIEYVPVRSESEALILEYRFIKEHRPKYNVRLKDDKCYPLIRLSVQEPLPKLSVVRVAKDDGARYFGRYTDAGAMKRTLEWIQKYFRLRTCRPRNPTRKDWKHCMDYKLGRCIAPCVGEVSEEEYRQRVQEVSLFLEGRSQELRRYLEFRMKKAAKNEDFEKAAELRDLLEDIQKVISVRKTEIPLIRKQKDQAYDEMVELQEALNLDHLPRTIEAFDISNIMGQHAVGSMVYFDSGHPNKNFYRRFRIKTVLGINDFAMMQEVVYRRYLRVQKEKRKVPDLILIDGGKGQLSAALAALWKLGFEKCSVVGLAKRYEELFLPQKSKPIILPAQSLALKLVQRVRDEAHRFAISFHKQLRNQRIRESVLDDIEGIGQKRKKALLKHFGSISKIRKSLIEEIAGVGKVGKTLAKVIKEALQKRKNSV